jgi:hypothetical protein
MSLKGARDEEVISDYVAIGGRGLRNQGDVIRLRSENSKNEEPRTMILAGDLGELIERRRETDK